MITDPIADMLVRIKNASAAGHEKLDVPASKIKANICKVLKEEGFIRSFKILAKSNTEIKIRIYLKENGITGISRISRPGLRVYKGYDSVERVISGLGISVLSTSRGVISSRHAKKMKVGGEVLCNIW